MKTLLMFSALLWETDVDAHPLLYEFGFLDNDGVFQPWKTQAGNEYTIAVPPGYGPNNTLTLRLKVLAFCFEFNIGFHRILFGLVYTDRELTMYVG